MVGVVMGHGSFDGESGVVTVPKGLPVCFYADEGTPMVMVNVLELAKRGNPKIPLHTANPGDPVPNYRYEPFKPHELAALAVFNELTEPQIIVGGPAQLTTLRLCADPVKCPKDGPHTCDGVFGRAAKAHWTKLLVLSCRIDMRKRNDPTIALKTADGRLDTSVYDTLGNWVRGFVALGAAAQDPAWTALTDRDRTRYIATDDEMREWKDCLDVRTRIAADKAKAPAVVAAASTAIKLRLLRDYPQHRDLVKAAVTLTPAEKQTIAAFLQKGLGPQVDEWYDLTSEEQLRWMTEPALLSWAQGFYVLELFDYKVRGDDLMAILRRLDPAAKAVVLSEKKVRDYLAANSLTI
ncbi:putative adhesin [Actinokineospora sp. HUAS TT18]|uniref:putative adhesin n=1 Tax=Actinokineospora sp. HUAS TT18 TaxID=3447451 RepID=UPI003F5237FA